MKLLLCFLLCTLGFSKIFGQCDAPVVTSWLATDPSNITIYFDPPEGALTYKLKIYGEYGFSDGMSFSPNVYSGEIVPGENSVSFNPTFFLSPSQQINLPRFYFSAELSVTCDNGEISTINRFYVSPHSMRNDPLIDLGEIIEPMAVIPDGIGSDLDTYIVIDEEDYPDGIEDLSVFVDIGHTYLGDLTIELISPHGITTTLMPQTSGLNIWGLSMVFQDGAPTMEGMENAYGFFGPHEPLSVFQGLDPSGVWILRVGDNLSIDDGMLFGVSLIINTSLCEATLSGSAYYDNNANGTQDPEEPGLPLLKVANSLDGSVTIGYGTGNYVLCTASGEGILSLVNTPDYHTTDNRSFATAPGDAVADLDFPLVPIPGMDDLHVEIFNTMPNRPGFTGTYNVIYGNVGTECIQDIDVTAFFEPHLNPVDVSVDAAIDGQEVAIHIDELCPQESGMISITILTDDTVTIGTLSTVTAMIEPLEGDQTPEDNVSESLDMIVGAFDPNDKAVDTEVISPTFLAEQEALNYLVRFQNTGNYYAERVLIVDTLDALLNIESLNLTAHSHPVEVTNNGNVFYFEFDEIFLPDSATDEAGSQGFLRFEVIPYPDLPVGTVISNSASIYFDFNPPIHTNTVTTTVDIPQGVSDVRIVAQVFPNPAGKDLEVLLPQGVSIEDIAIYDLSGRTVKRMVGSESPSMRIPISDLKPGVYLLRINNGLPIRPVMFVKE